MSQPTKEQKQAEYQRHKEKYIARARRWAAANPEKRREIVKRNNDKSSQRKKDWHQIKRFGHIIRKEECIKCGAIEGLLIHHIDGNNGKLGKPLNNSRDNLTVLCQVCHPKVHYRGKIREILTK